MGVIKKTICYAVLAMLFISGSTWGGEADEHISQFMEMVSKMEIDQKVEYRFSFHAPGEELSDANEIIAYLDQTPERVMVIAEESIGSVCGSV